MHQVFVDANIFYSRTLRDWLALIFLQNDRSTYAAYWSEDVLAEVMYHLRRKHPAWHGSRITAIHDRLTHTFEVGRVAEYTVAPAAGAKDPQDLYVHAAALACEADILLTCNVKDYSSTEQYDVMSPDEFFVLVDDTSPAAVRGATKEQAHYWGRRQQEVDLPVQLRRAGCEEFAKRILGHLQVLALTSR